MISTAGDILKTIQTSPYHMAALRAVRSLGNDQQYWIAAGFVRNHIWDVVHDYENVTPLNDIDVIYYDAVNQNEAFEKAQEQSLSAQIPGLPWSVKNQARMHVKNGDDPYDSIEAALEHWCETVTPIGVRLDATDRLHLLAPLGVDDLLALRCHATPFAKSKPAKLHDYRSRMQDKAWWTIWPRVKVFDL